MKLFAGGTARRRQADLHELGRARPALGRRHASIIPTSCSRRARAATASSSAKTPRATAGPTSSPSSPTSSASRPSLTFCQGRRHRPRRRRTRCSSRTPTATTRPTCARCCSPAGAPATRTPGRATCSTASTTGSTACVGYAGFDGDRRRRDASLPAGLLPLQAGRLEAGVPAQHQQQLLGPRLQRGGLALRLDGQRQPQRLPADPEPLLRNGPRLVVRRVLAEHRRRATGSSRSPTRCGRSTGTAASRPAAGHALYTARTYPQEYWNRTAFVSEPTGHLVGDVRAAAATAATSSSTQRAGTCWPATTSGPRRSWPRSGPTATSG